MRKVALEMKAVQRNTMNYIVCNNMKNIVPIIDKKYRDNMKNILLIFPLNEEINLNNIKSDTLSKIDTVICAGDGKEDNPCICDFSYVIKLRDDCKNLNKNFIFRDTGRRFKMNDKIYNIPKAVGKSQAQKANVDFYRSDVDKEVFFYESLWEKLAKSKFRSKFELTQKGKEYVKQKGQEQIRSHAYEFIEKRLSPHNPKNDGRQTPLKGHPVFVAQHATGTCCRGCLEKWHHIKQQKQLNPDEINYICEVLLEWINHQI